MKQMTDQEKFDKYNSKDGPIPAHKPELGKCHLWVGAKGYTGYGINPAMSETRAHRMAWVLKFGPIPNGKWILHKCDNPSCVNWEHLWLGTPKDNSADRDAKGRAYIKYGEEAPIAKLTEVAVRDIRAMHATGISSYDIHAKYNFVTHKTIRRVINFIFWKHVK